MFHGFTGGACLLYVYLFGENGAAVPLHRGVALEAGLSAAGDGSN